MFMRVGFQELIVLGLIMLVAAPVVITAIIGILTYIHKNTKRNG